MVVVPAFDSLEICGSYCFLDGFFEYWAGVFVCVADVVLVIMAYGDCVCGFGWRWKVQGVSVMRIRDYGGLAIG